MRARIFFPILAAAGLWASPAARGSEDAGDAADAGAGEDAAAARAEDAGSSDAEASPPSESLPFLGPVPDEKSKPPKPAEWAKAPAIGNRGRRFDCKVHRVREWLRVRCEMLRSAGIELVTGRKTDVYFSLKFGGGTCVDTMDVDETGQPYKQNTCWDALEVVFPLRRGDRRVFQMSEAVFQGYMGGMLMRGKIVISETFLDGDPGPVVTIIEE